MVTKMMPATLHLAVAPGVFIKCTALCFLVNLANFSFCFAIQPIVGHLFWLLTASMCALS